MTVNELLDLSVAELTSSDVFECVNNDDRENYILCKSLECLLTLYVNSELSVKDLNQITYCKNEILINLKFLFLLNQPGFRFVNQHSVEYQRAVYFYHLLKSKQPLLIGSIVHFPFPERESSDYIQKLNVLSESLHTKLLSNPEDAEAFSVKLVNQEDKFVCGKAFLSFIETHVLFKESVSDRVIVQFRKFISPFLNFDVSGFGVLFYLKGLYLLSIRGFLNRFFTATELRQLQGVLHCNDIYSFENGKLLISSKNFIGLVYGILRYRQGLGWDSNSDAIDILDYILEHYLKTSFDSGYSDETNGHGRFDRYSFLLAAEISNIHHILQTPLPPVIIKALKSSLEFVKLNLNDEGRGFSYGRSIGPYGDSAFIEIIAAGLVHGLISTTDLPSFYQFTNRVTRRLLDYWYDNEEGSVNLWFKGRTTDNYRGEHRILGENFTLFHQHLYVHQYWLTFGLSRGYQPKQEQPVVSEVINFKSKNWERALIVNRNTGELLTLPLVNGFNFYNSVFYAPIPYYDSFLHAKPASSRFPLIPEVIFEDGAKACPLVFFKELEVNKSDSNTKVKFSNPCYCLLEQKRPEQTQAVSSTTEYVFSKNRLCRDEIIKLGDDVATLRFNFPVKDSMLINDFTIAVNDHLKSTISFSIRSEGKELTHNGLQSVKEDNEQEYIVAVYDIKGLNELIVHWCIDFKRK